MSKRCGTISEDHRQKVAEGVKRAWKRRHEEGFEPKGPAAKLNKIARILSTSDPVWAVEYLEKSHREICTKLQECVQKYRLGLPGQFTVNTVIAELERLKALEGKETK